VEDGSSEQRAGPIGRDLREVGEHEDDRRHDHPNGSELAKISMIETESSWRCWRAIAAKLRNVLASMLEHFPLARTRVRLDREEL
jgi:hypothetical protein